MSMETQNQYLNLFYRLSLAGTIVIYFHLEKMLKVQSLLSKKLLKQAMENVNFFLVPTCGLIKLINFIVYCFPTIVLTRDFFLSTYGNITIPIYEYL